MRKITWTLQWVGKSASVEHAHKKAGMFRCVGMVTNTMPQ